MKRIIAFILTVVLLSTSFVFADNLTNDPNTMYADSLKELGVFNGTDKGYELDRVPTRIEGAVMLVRLLGKEKEALAITKTLHPFKDVPAWADKYISYMYSSGLTKGKSATEFGSNDILSANQYATFLLRALGYEESTGDFTWDKAMDKAYEVKMIYAGEKKYTCKEKYH